MRVGFRGPLNPVVPAVSSHNLVRMIIAMGGGGGTGRRYYIHVLASSPDNYLLRKPNVFVSLPLILWRDEFFYTECLVEIW